MDYVSREEMELQVDKILQSPKNDGVLKMIVRRPEVDLRTVLEKGELSISEGLTGDSWRNRVMKKNPNKLPDRKTQLTLMNARVIEVVARDEDNWPLAGDQLFVDMELSEEKLPPGSRLSIGLSEIEITAVPHTGCGKFKKRFGSDALKFVNSEIGKKHRFRGIYAKVIKAGEINKGDIIRKLNN